MRRRPSKTEPRCSFCARSAGQVDKIITGPSVHICNECVKLCNDVLAEDKKQTLPWETGTLPKPLDIKSHLDEYVISQDRAKNKEVFEGTARLVLGAPELQLKIFIATSRLNRPGVVLPLPDDKRRCD